MKKQDRKTLYQFFLSNNAEAPPSILLSSLLLLSADS